MKKGNAPLTLGTAPIGKLLMQYAAPAVIAMTAASLYNITDSIFIGHGVGPLALSGLTVSFPLMNLAAAFGSLVGMGGSALLSLRLGQKDYDSANRILGNVLVLNIAVGLLFSAASFIFLKPMLYFFGASEHTIGYAYDFMCVILAGNVITHVYMGMNALLRSSGNPKKAMFATVLTILINVILNPLFIFGFGWGIRGSALATVISQAAVLAWQFKFFADKENFLHMRKGVYKLKSEIVKGIVSIGFAPFLLNAAACVIVVLINRQLLFYGAHLGELAVGAYGIVSRVAFLFGMIVFGISQGMQPIAGYNFGAGLYGRVAEVLKKAVFLATIVMTAGFVAVELFPHAVASVFTRDKDLVDLTVTGLRFVFALFPLVGFQMVASMFFQSIGRAAKTVFLSVSRQLLFLVPLLLILPKYFGINGIWMSMPAADLISVFTAVILLWVQFREFKKPKQETV